MNAKRAYGIKSKYDFTVRFNKMLRIFGYCYTDTAKYNEIIKERNDHVLIFYNSNLPIKKIEADNIKYIGINLPEFVESVKNGLRDVFAAANQVFETIPKHKEL